MAVSKRKSEGFNWVNGITIIATVISVVISIFALKIAQQANQISQIESKLLEISSQPYEPHIEHLQGVQDWNIHASEFLKWKLANGSIFLHKPYSTLMLFNFGRIDTQWTRCSVDWNNNSFWAQFQDSYPEYLLSSTDFVFKNIATGTANRTGFWIYYVPCGNDINVCSNISNIPLGKQKIKLNCDCYWCKIQNTFNINLSFCIYRDNISECQ